MRTEARVSVIRDGEAEGERRLPMPLLPAMAPDGSGVETGAPARDEETAMSKPFLMFHWAPVERRRSITRHGLTPGKRSRCGQWKPPHICFSNSPSWAWAASAGLSEERGEWDLWMCWSGEASGYERLPNARAQCAEYRVYETIPKSKIWFVGTRLREPGRRRN